MSSTIDSDVDYLGPGFDPSTLTVPRLRSILVSHNVEYPASAKKAQLIEIFNDYVVPQSRRILTAHARTKRTSRGITDVESSQESATTGNDDDVDETILPPLKDAPQQIETSRTSRTTQKSFPAVPQSIHSEHRFSHKHARESDAEVSTGVEPKRPMMRKTRRSKIGPSEDDYTVEPSAIRQHDEDSVFTYDNPFQSGSSPPGGGERRVSAGRRKKSTGLSTSRDGVRRKSSKRPSSAQDGTMVPTAKNFEVQLGGRSAERDEEDALSRLEPGEEFTPDEQLALAQESLKAGVRDILPPRRTGQQSRGGWGRSAPWAIILTLLGGYATWWRREKLEVGYCGIGRPSMALSDARIPDWASVLQPQCEPCPPHAYCYGGLETTCEPNYVLQPHPLSLGGIIPLAPTCEPDGERVRKIKTVADRAVDELRDRRAKYECGELESGEPAEVNEEDLKNTVAQKRRKTMSNAEFEELWKGAIGEVVGMDEVVSSVDPRTGSRVLSSSSLSRLRLGCAIRRSARLAVARHRVELGLLGTLVLLVLSLRQYIHALTTARARVPELVKLTLDRLAIQAALHAQDPRAVPEPWISAAQLRDDVLRDEFSPRRREELWKRVRTVVEMNANVRASVREGRGGEVSRVWEWIGSVGAIEDGGGGSAGRARSRLSLGAPGSASSTSPAPSSRALAAPEDLTVSRFGEQRPIY